MYDRRYWWNCEGGPNQGRIEGMNGCKRGDNGRSLNVDMQVIDNAQTQRNREKYTRQ